MSTDQRRICVSICERDVSSLITAIKSSAEIANFVELRLDCIAENELRSTTVELRKLPQNSLLSTIITFRPFEQGGLRPLNFDDRRYFWREYGFQLPANFFDLEIDLAEEFFENNEQVDWSRVICSVHDFDGGVVDLNNLYDRLARLPAKILKIAVTVDDAIDNIEIFNLLDRAKSEGRELIAIGMGSAGVATRVLGPARGSFLTYGAQNRLGSTAPAQLTVSELRNEFRIEQISDSTQVLGLIGHPVVHSLSPQVHNAVFKTLALDAVYLPFEVKDLASFMLRMVKPATREIDWRMRGLSVTTPHKREVMAHLDWIDPAASEIGAVNTIVIDNDELNGYNTDAIGFINPLKTRLPNLRGARCAVIGGGGAAHAAIWALLREGASVSVFVRDVERAKPLTEGFDVPVGELKDAAFEGCDVVVNATVLGTTGDFERDTPASAQQLRGARLAYDLVYNPTETRFLSEAEQVGCETLGGLSMFVAQAAEQFRLWTGREAPTEVMRIAAMEALTQQ